VKADCPFLLEYFRAGLAMKIHSISSRCSAGGRLSSSVPEASREWNSVSF